MYTMYLGGGLAIMRMYGQYRIVNIRKTMRTVSYGLKEGFWIN